MDSFAWMILLLENQSHYFVLCIYKYFEKIGQFIRVLSQVASLGGYCYKNISVLDDQLPSGISDNTLPYYFQSFASVIIECLDSISFSLIQNILILFILGLYLENAFAPNAELFKRILAIIRQPLSIFRIGIDFLLKI